MPTRIAAGLIVAVLVVAAPPAVGAILEVGPLRPLARPSDAARLARDGDTILIDPGSYEDCAVWAASRLTIEGRAPGVVLHGPVCAGKAIFVTAGDAITVRGITFSGARAAAHNGAGIRAEGSNLTVEGARFLDDENGILAADAPDSTIRISGSEFKGDGSCVAACGHAIYIGRVAALRVLDSRFAETHAGHHIKSRARATTILRCRIEDTGEVGSSYLIDLPNGGLALIAGNRMVKGPRSDNPGAAIAIGAEGVTNPTPSLEIGDNDFTNAQAFPTVFVRNLTAIDAWLRGNTLHGAVTALSGPGNVR